MKRSWKIQVLAGVAFVLVALGVYGWRAREPRYEGRSVSEWLGDVGGPMNEKTIQAEAAIRALGPRALPTMVKMLEIRDQTLREKLIEISDRQSYIKFGFKTAGERHFAALCGFYVLGRTAEPAIPELTALLAKGERTFDSAVRALAAIGDPAIDPMISATTNANPQIRAGAFCVLEKASESKPKIVAALIPLLKSDDTDTRYYAANTLGALGTEPSRVITALTAVLEDRQLAVRRSATRALQRFEGNRLVIPALLVALTNSNAEVRAQAASSLAKFPATDTSYVNGLVDALHDSAPQVRKAAAMALQSYEIAPEIILPVLIEMLSARDATSQMMAIQKLGSFGAQARATIPALQKLRDDTAASGNPSRTISQLAAQALGEIEAAMEKELRAGK